MDQGLLALGDSAQNILQLRTPSGGPPVDSQFSSITIKHLLEHTSGLNPGGNGGFDDAIAVQKAFSMPGQPPANLPVTAAMTNSFIASLKLQSPPGKTQVYSNCGYYLLSQVAAKLRNQPSAMAACQYLFNPLAITRIRGFVSLVTAQPADEARYQNYDIPVAQSVMSNARPLVPEGYGDWQMEIGNVSGAATDLARLIAILISQNNNPAMSRTILATMLQAAAQVKSTNGRAGYGFDDVHTVTNSNNPYYGQKGGSEGSCAAVLEFSGDWGFTVLWGNGRPGQPGQPVWYPDFPSVMNVAKNTNWSSQDLFPQFGMLSL